MCASAISLSVCVCVVWGQSECGEKSVSSGRPYSSPSWRETPALLTNNSSRSAPSPPPAVSSSFSLSLTNFSLHAQPLYHKCFTRSIYTKHRIALCHIKPHISISSLFVSNSQPKIFHQFKITTEGWIKINLWMQQSIWRLKCTIDTH